jgi:signal peptidase II
MKTFTKNTILLIGLILLDQLLKFWFESSKLFANLGLAVLHVVTNTGASFGMLQGSNALLAWFSVIVLGIIMMNADKVKENKNQVLPVILIVAGLLGNLIDRVFRGYVVDFIDFRFWPVFNLADSCVVIGVIWLCLTMLRTDAKKPKPQIPSQGNKAKKKR